MPGHPRSHRSNRSHPNYSDFDDTALRAVTALGKATAALVWASVLFPMISIPVITSVWIAITCGPLFGLLAAVWSALALFSWFLLSPKTFRQWVTVRLCHSPG